MTSKNTEPTNKQLERSESPDAKELAARVSHAVARRAAARMLHYGELAKPAAGIPDPEKWTTQLGGGLIISDETAAQIVADAEPVQNGVEYRGGEADIEPFYPAADRQKAFEATAKAIEIANEVDNTHDLITQEQVDRESLVFLSDPQVRAYVEQLVAKGQKFHIGFDLAERFSKEALKELAKSARMTENSNFYKWYKVIDAASDDELSGDLTPSTAGGRLRFLIYLDGPDAPKLTGIVKDMQQQEQKLRANNPDGLQYVARKFIQPGIFNALQMKEQGKLNDDATRWEMTYTRSIDQGPVVSAASWASM